MKPARFEYTAPRTVPEALAALADTGRDVRVLAGGQSLLLEMRLQRLRPDLLVDINRIAGLDRLGVDDGMVEVGALVRHEVFDSPWAVPGPLGTLLSLAAPNIAHPPIRALGTMVGSLAWAHPASEWCAIAAALDAVIRLRGPEGAREVPARDWFRGPFETARRPGELLTSVRLPLLGEGTGVGFIEHRRTHFSFAQVGVAAALTVRDGVVVEARIGLANCADRPVRARAAEQALVGAEIGSTLFARAGRVAADQDAAPLAEPYADVEYRRHAIAVLVGRTLRQAAEGARQ
ncbi:xanthine dehydrogenase family protein subunit M [Acrocarpospora macrocephala]|uniref:Carbon-monoxide dehydrogenase medium subunit n=1 Tax=Acrocarpospora macrocephala TaxID=150177 RepID=A0A5M3WYA5_9ACTN|nr:xanthine dehydrogenase family protein subunit M [Acrocarpospora macrocephala]GES11503.1 carbon-monoxide dehydrogenase medium subunit [Acrocarpospora macrocephala]